MKRMEMADKGTQTPIKPPSKSSSSDSDSPRDISDYPLPPTPPMVRPPMQPPFRALQRGPQRALQRFPQEPEIPLQVRRHPRFPMHNWIEYARAPDEGSSRFPRYERLETRPTSSVPSAVAADEPKEQNETRLHGEGDALLRVDLIPDEDKVVDVENVDLDDESP